MPYMLAIILRQKTKTKTKKLLTENIFSESQGLSKQYIHEWSVAFLHHD